MEFKISSKNFEVTPAIGQYAEKRFTKLSKYFEGLIEIHINFIKEGKGANYTAEVTIFGDGVVLHSEDKREDLYQTIDMVVEKLERQLKKYKDKIRVRKSKESLKTEMIEKTFAENEERMFGEDRVVFLPLNTKPMNTEEAILQLKSLNLQFLMFQNTDNGKVCLIYRKKDGIFAVMS